jgi:putative ABC transport system permease protein
MSFIDGLRHQLRVWLHRDDYEREIDDEMRLHLSLDAAQQRGPGIAGAADAAFAAQRRFGNLTFLKEERRRVAGLHLLDGVALDGRHLLRSLRGSPGFAVVAILTLGLGIGVTTAVVSITDHVLIRGLPFRDSGRLMMMLELDQHGAYRTPSAPTAADWKADAGVARALEGVTYIRGDGVTLRVGDDSETVGAAYVAPEFFTLLGVRPVLGRLLLRDDHNPGAAAVAVMSHKLWQRRYGGDRAIIGRSVSVDSMPTTIVGVLPSGAVYPGFADLWTPIEHYPRKAILLRRGFHADSRTMGRLRAGVDSTRAIALMRTVGARLAADYPAEQKGWMPTMIQVRTEIIGDIAPMLFTLAGAAAAVLLLACANVAGLLLARATTRSRELAVRSALGASRGRIVRQLLTESLILAAMGGALGMAFAAFGVTLSKKFFGDRLPRVEELSVDHRVLAIAAVATILTALLCGIWPALRATRQRSAEVLRAGSLGSIGVRSDSRLRRLLVTVQFALALVLLIGAGLLLQSFRRAAAVGVGFDPSGLLAVRIAPPAGAYTTPKEAAALYARVMDAARSVPGVGETAFINHSPFGGASMFTYLTVEGRSTLDSSNQIYYRTVSASYLRTMKMSMAAGRWFDDDDMRSPGGSFVINETMAKQYWPGASPLGQRITVTRASQGRSDFGQPLPGSIIGVVADVHQKAQDVAPDAEIYVPYTLETWPWGMLIMRARDGKRAIPALVRAIASVDPRLIATGKGAASAFGVFGSFDEMIADRLKPRRLSMALIAAFAACALTLAAIGMYGVVAYSIAQRRREIGVRKALGATDARIVALIFRESLLVIAVGVLLGVAGAAGGARLIRGLLFNTGVADPSAYVATIALLAAASVLATYLPARRATRLDPAIAMRGE